MSDPNQHIVDELNRFRETAETFYALQIDAPWGSGKTHFITHYIENHCPKGTEDSPKNLVISLFGVKSVQEIEQRIASQLFSGGERLAGTVFSTIATGFSGFFKVDKAVTGAMEESRAIILSQRLQQVRGGILVFDDVERCSMKLVDALGYINTFIEKEKFKVVIVSNEQALKRSSATKDEQENAILLAGFKEKLIGRTLHLKADPEKAYDAFAKSLKSIKSKEIADNGKIFVLSIFRSSKRENLRSLRIALEAFDRLVAGLDTSIPVKDDGLRDILGGCVYVACEAGAAVKHDLISQPTSGSLSRMMRSVGNRIPSEPTEDEKVLDELCKRYSDTLNLQSPTIPFDILVDFITSGLLRRTEIEKSLRISPLMAEPSAVPLWRRLIEVWHFNSQRLKDDTLELIDKFAKSEILDPGELIHLAGIMLWRESFGDLSISANVDPEEFINKYLDSLKASGKNLEVKLDIFAIDRLSAYGYMVLATDEFRDKLLRIQTRIREAMDEAASLNYPKAYKALCEKIISDDRDMNHLLSDELSPYLRMPILAVADSREFADIIMRNDQFDASLLKWLNDRYSHLVTHTTRSIEQAWLDGLYHELSSRIASCPPPLDKWWMTILDQNLKQFITPPAPVPPEAVQVDGDVSDQSGIE